MRQLIFLTSVMILLSACGSSGGGGSSQKGVFSEWSTGSKTVVLTGGQFGVPFIIQDALAGGAICEFQMTISGDNSSGVYITTDGIYEGGGSGDPGCASFDNGGTYTDNGTTLTVCPASQPCTTYN